MFLRNRLCFAFLLAAACSVCSYAETPNADLLSLGEKIYRESCANCHGDKGQGAEDSYSEPLVGDLSAGELTKVIADTMPEEDPETCVGEDAAAVAYFIHHAFYSPAAQLRNRPPSAQFSRLTGAQLRQSIADLYGHFQNPVWREQKHGLKGLYFKGPHWKKENIKIDRIDPALDFDFGTESPGEGIDAKEFYIEWTGSLKTDHTGRYEIVLRSSCSSMMYLGHVNREFINNHVQSAGKTEFRHSIVLTAGRLYPIKIGFMQRKRKTEQPPASVSLSWVAPGGVEERIPTQNLIPELMPGTFSLQTKLPPDDRSYGYDRGTVIDRAWDDSTTRVALEFAQIAIDELYPRYRHRGDNNDNRARLRGFLTELIETAFRGPADEATKQLFIDSQLAKAEDDGEAIKRVCLLALKSPRFLYPAADVNRSPSQRIANRLALVLFDSLPSDRRLMDAARKGHLKNDQQIEQAARLMVNDYRTQAKLRAFLYEWFDLASVDEISKDAEKFPEFDPSLVGDLRKSFDAFLDEIAWSESSDFRQLLQADWAYTNERIHSFYGDAWKPDKEDGLSLRRSVADAKTRIGALSHPLVMSNLAYHNTSSPIHRGVFLIRHVLGRTMRPPDAAFTPLNPDLHPDLTTRQRVELQTAEPNCQVCHQKINSLGFALENFDAVGRFRTTEHGKQVDAKGIYTTRTGENVSFTSPRDLADYLAASDDCHRAFVESTFEYFVKQPIAAYGPDTLEKLAKQFRDSGFSIRELLVAIAVTTAKDPPTPTST